jgi:dTDP-4-dehydrorhamnose reductase
MARVLITGASGLLGANLVLAARLEDDVTAVYHRHPIRRQGVRCLDADLSQPGVAGALMADIRPDWVVHCAAATDVDACEREPQWAERLNRDMAGWVADATSKAGARLVHISTDAVFDGVRASHDEDETPSPVNVYGRTKLEGEMAVLAAHPKAAVVRTNLFGWNAQPKAGLAEWFLHRLERGLTCPGFTDVTFSPILATDLGAWLWRLLEAGLEGVWHMGGQTCLSKFDFGVRLAKALDHDPTRVVEARVMDAGLSASRPLHLCLQSDRIQQALGGKLPAIDEGIDRLVEMDRGTAREALKRMAAADRGEA